MTSTHEVLNDLELPGSGPAVPPDAWVPLPSLRDFVAGTAAGVTICLVGHPLDTVKVCFVEHPRDTVNVL